MKDEIKDHLGKTYSNEKEMCEAYGIDKSVFYQRFHVLNWELEDALTKEVRSQIGRKRNEVISKEKEVKKTAKNKDEFFVPESNYPSKEYWRFLQERKLALIKRYEEEKESLIKGAILDSITATEKKISIIAHECLHYYVKDMIFAGEEEKAREMCSRMTYQSCLLDLNCLHGLDETIYVYFANDFGLENKSSGLG